MIRFFFVFLEGKSDNELKERLNAVYGDASSSMVTVDNWFDERQVTRRAGILVEDLQ